MVQCRHCSRLCRVAWGPKADKKHMFEQQAKLLSFFLSSVPVPPPFADVDTLDHVWQRDYVADVYEESD